MAKKGGAPTKSEVLTHISKDTGLSRKQVGTVFDSLGNVIKKSLRGNGLFTMPGLLKMKVVKRPATKAREGVNPFTGEKMMFKAKPASKKGRVMPLTSRKSMVNQGAPNRPADRRAAEPRAASPARSFRGRAFCYLRSPKRRRKSSTVSRSWLMRPWKKCPAPGRSLSSGGGEILPAHSITAAGDTTSSASP